MMHRFPDGYTFDIPERLNDPFRYAPHPAVKAAAELMAERIREINPDGEGKMMGILLVKDSAGEIGFLAGFSGNIGGRNILDGFVPPIYDLLDPEGPFKKEEAEISFLNSRIDILENSEEIRNLRNGLDGIYKEMDSDIEEHKRNMAVSRIIREGIRSSTDDPEVLAGLIRKSQHEKAELKRIKMAWEERVSEIKTQLNALESDIRILKEERAQRSDRLQQWIFGEYKVLNAKGEESSIRDIFARKGLTPPGGTGECAAPKLLNYAYRNSLTPLAMGEFWYGKASLTAVRTHGRFYPSCTSKCGPLLEYMLDGLEYGMAATEQQEPVIIYEDDNIIALSKPSGMPSVPGLDGRFSLFEWLDEKGKKSHPVHRLDMDTSGIILFAVDTASALSLRNQFEQHSISKKYLARLSAGEAISQSSGKIECRLSPDYDERPRQKVDPQQGKEAITLYEVEKNNEDGTTDIIFRPVTGRTHQLRVHSAHSCGLGRPIAGDLLYGGDEASRLMLHAFEITFKHPSSGVEMTLSTLANSYLPQQ